MLRLRYDYLLNNLRDDLVRFGRMVENALESATTSLKTWDSTTAKRIIQDDDQIDAARYEIEERAMTLLATQQPVASDLRLLSVVVAIATELERVGDYASDIASRIKDADGRQIVVSPPAGIDTMSTLARQMIHTSLEAFLHRDSDLARNLGADDERVDALEKALRAELLDLARTDSQRIDAVADLLDVVHMLERVADRATNIGERVIYLINSSIEDLNP